MQPGENPKEGIMHKYVIHFCPIKKGESRFGFEVEVPIEINKGQILHFSQEGELESKRRESREKKRKPDDSDPLPKHWIVDEVIHYLQAGFHCDVALVIVSPTVLPLRHA